MLTHLSLYTTNPQRLQAFYSQTLGLPTQATDRGFMLTVGQTTLHWHKVDFATPYHYAINIPSNKVPEALAWLKARTAILPFKGKEVVDFKAWNAEAMYCYDPDGNIVELIARHHTQPDREASFDSTQFLGVSEIGAPVRDMAAACWFLEQKAGLPLYSGDRAQFAAIGDEEGLFIVIDQMSKQWMPCNDRAWPSPFEATVVWKEQKLTLRYDNEGWQLLSR